MAREARSVCRVTARLLALGCLAALAPELAAHARAQAYTPPPPPLTTAPCVPTKKAPCDAPAPATAAPSPRFPFPGDQPAAASSGASQPAGSQAGGKQFPFPGEPGDAPAQTPGQTPAQTPAASSAPKPPPKFPFPGEPEDADSSSSSSSSSRDGLPAGDPDTDSPDDPAKAGLKDRGSTGSTRFQRRKLAVPEDVDHRELEDLDVSHYYMTTGNYIAAYARAQDAVRLYPDDENAHLALALSAEKLKKNSEAVAEYKAYLKLAPDGDKAKLAEHALQTLPPK